MANIKTKICMISTLFFLLLIDQKESWFPKKIKNPITTQILHKSIELKHATSERVCRQIPYAKVETFDHEVRINVPLHRNLQRSLAKTIDPQIWCKSGVFMSQMKYTE